MLPGDLVLSHILWTSPGDGGGDGGSSGSGSFSAFSFPTNTLWLQITNVANGQAYLNLMYGTDYVYEIYSKTDLTASNWDIAGEVFPTDTNCMPFTVPATDQTNLFIWARDWTGITSNGNETPEWWFYKYFGTVDLSDTNLDPLGNTLLYDYTYDYDPNLIAFNFDLPLTPLASNQVSTVIDVVRGNPAYMAVLVNDTNHADAVWQPYSSNLVVNLDLGNGVYNVLVGLRGLPDDATQTWHVNRASLYSVPLTLTITNPMATTVSVPLIQLQGYANEVLASLTFDVSNATGIFTNQTGSITGQYYDTNLLAFTTNYFQCYDIALVTNGVNIVTLHATDLTGNTTTTNIILTLNYSAVTNPPMLTVIWPANATAISGTNFTLQAQVDDVTATITASIKDTNGDVTVVSGLIERSGLVWVINLPLSSGTNLVTLTATNAAGLGSTTNMNVVQNNVGLTINPLSQLNQSSVTVTGRVSNSSYKISVNGVAATVKSGGTWSAANVPVSPTGTASLNVQVSDSSGHPLTAKNVYQPQPATVVAVNYSVTSHEVDILDMFVKPTPSVANYVAGWTYDQGGQWNAWGWGESLDGGTDDGPTSYNDGGSITAVPIWENVNFNGSLDPYRTLQETIQTKVAILPGGQAAVGQTVLYLVQAQVLNVDTGLQLAANAVQFMNQLAGTAAEDVTHNDGSVWTEAVVSGASGANVEVTPIAAGNISYTGMKLSKLVYISVDSNNKPPTFDAQQVQSTFQTELLNNVFYSLPTGEGVQIMVHVGPSYGGTLGWNSSKQTYVSRVVWNQNYAGGLAASPAKDGNTTIDPIACRNYNTGSDPGIQFWVNILAHEIIWLNVCGGADHDLTPPAGEISSGLEPPLTASFTVWPANQAYIISKFGF